MKTLGLLAPFVMLFVSAVIQIKTDPRITHEFVLKSLLALLVFAIHGLIGFGVISFIGFVLYTGPDRDRLAIGLVAAWLGWLGLGTLGLMRHAPRTQEPPNWLMHFGVADIFFILLSAGGLVFVTTLFF